MEKDVKLAMFTDEGFGSAVKALNLIGNVGIAAEFKKFMRDFDKEYMSAREVLNRFKVFKENWHLIHRTNAAKLSYTLHVNKFADMSWQEFSQHWLGASQTCSATKGNHAISSSAPPPSKDWRKSGIVTPIKNQRRCGSCWTFSSTGALEAAWSQKTGINISLSEQQLVDCAFNFDNHGCNGGLPSQAFEYILYNGGLDSEDSYPYHAKTESCKFNPDAVAIKVKDVVNITEYDEEQLRDAVGRVRPVSIAYEVAHDFRFYKSGVYTSTICKSGPETVNHAVLAVGYETEAAIPFWIIKNSWGEDWGDHGYFLMELGKNMCGIATCASYPVV